MVNSRLIEFRGDNIHIESHRIGLCGTDLHLIHVRPPILFQLTIVKAPQRRGTAHRKRLSPPDA